MTRSDQAGTPLMRQVQKVKRQYPDAIVLFRMGDFYETFNEDAQITAKILGIVLTKRANGAAAEVPLAGFPYHAIDNYLPKLVNAGHRVAICEQVEDPRLAKGLVRREVVEVVTPGTLTSERALSQKVNHYLACLTIQRDRAGYAILDPSTGEFYLGECDRHRLTEALRKFAPREALVSAATVFAEADWYRDLKPFVTPVEDWLYNREQSYRTLTQHFQVASLKGFGCEELDLGLTTAGVIIHHIQHTLNGSLDHITSLHPVREEGILGLDAFTIRNLEVFQSLSTQGTHGTLIEILEHTLTAGGGRLLRRWLNRPLTDLRRLNRRLDMVAGLVKSKPLLKDLRAQLKQLSDLERILGKINRQKASPREFIGLRTSLDLIPGLKSRLEDSDQPALVKFGQRFTDTIPVADLIRATLQEDPPAQLHSGPVIAERVDEELDRLRELSRGGKEWIAELQEKERQATGIPSLKIGYNKVFGYYLEVTKTHQERVPADYIRKQTLVNSERYVTPDLKTWEEKILTAEEEIAAIETRLFRALGRDILAQASRIQANAAVLNRLDLFTTLAQVARANRYVRPRLTSRPRIEIEAGRHPVVEKLLPPTERFIPNDTKMEAHRNQIHLITGPNMAGKSTYLRQVGLIVLLAQIGSFVPARRATLGIVDKLFTRVGASDNLAGGESTFLMEMNEAANILNNATPQSLILLDEIGRGTATYDGLSLAWAITEHLHNHPPVAARTLFATHYHELTELENTLKRLENHHVAVKEFGDRIVFLRRIRPGPGDKSYGLHVAQMAGLPREVLQRAGEILDHNLHQHHVSPHGAPPPSGQQVSLFEQQESEMRQELSQLDVENMTPVEAIQTLDALKKKHGL